MLPCHADAAADAARRLQRCRAILPRLHACRAAVAAFAIDADDADRYYVMLLLPR